MKRIGVNPVYHTSFQSAVQHHANDQMFLDILTPPSQSVWRNCLLMKSVWLQQSYHKPWRRSNELGAERKMEYRPIMTRKPEEKKHVQGRRGMRQTDYGIGYGDFPSLAKLTPCETGYLVFLSSVPD